MKRGIQAGIPSGAKNSPQYVRYMKAYSKIWRAIIKSDDVAQNVLRERQKKNKAQVRQREREMLIQAYGGVCRCCGESESKFMTLDHTKNNGAAQRRAMSTNRVTRGGAGTPFYTWLRQQGYPKRGYQLLCFNCNCGRHRNGGVCPHKKNR